MVIINEKGHSAGEKTLGSNDIALSAVSRVNADFHRINGRKRLARVITFGCKMNDNDSEKIMGLLLNMGYAIEPSPASGKFGNPAPLGALGNLNAGATADNSNEDMNVNRYPADAILNRSEDGAVSDQLPDLVILNTCCVRDNAEQRFYGILGSLKKYKAGDPSRILAICGCMMQEKKAVSNVLSKYSYVDFVFGTKAISGLPSLLLDAYRKRADSSLNADQKNSGYEPGVSRYKIIKNSDARYKGKIPVMNDIEGVEGVEIEDRLPMYRKAPPLALVSIMNGCDNYCSYCIVPFVRGREISRSPESVVREVERLASEGYREITLLGQNVNSYGNKTPTRPESSVGLGSPPVLDLPPGFDSSPGLGSPPGLGSSPQGCDFAGLLERLSVIDGVWRIRFMTSHPKDLSDRLICAMRDLDAVCPQLHLPIQSGSTAVLERMNRGYSREDYFELVRKLRIAVPGITLTTDIIVGFPGESEQDFDDTLSLVDEIKFDSAYTFLYSPREGTAAAGYSDQIPDAIKKDRFDRLLNIQNRISLDKNRAMIGGCYELLCEGVSKTNKERYTGRTPGGKVVNFMPAEDIGANRPGGFATSTPSPDNNIENLTGKLVRVRIKNARTWSLDGIIEAIL